MHNNEPQQNNLKETVLDKIRTGEVHMTPKAYYLIKVILVIVVTSLVLITSALLISYIFFSLSISGKLFLLGFGFQGFKVFFIMFPWNILIIELVLLVVLEWLLRRFKFGYRSPLIYAVAALLLASLVIGVIINMTSFHRVMMREAEQKRLPLVGDYYQNLRRPQQREMFRGTVISVKDNTFVMVLLKSETETLNVVLPVGTNAETIMEKGDTVFVAGTLYGKEIKAYGVKILPKDE